MTIEERIAAFSKLGKYIRAIDKATLETLVENVKNQNSWFTRESIELSLEGLTQFLDEERLTRWASAYSLPQPVPKTVGLVMAGNLPMVGFHDLLCVLISGHRALIKLSSKDKALIPFLTERLVVIEPRFADRILFAEDQMKGFDAIIATGSDNSARYFEYYFGKYPHIIRKNRTSVAVLTGHETRDELHGLAKDVLSFFGLGCRNVSKLFIPEDYKLPSLLDNWESFNAIIHHHKYHNNYDYQKSIMLVNKVPFLDNGFLMLHETDKLVSPISVLYYEYYSDLSSLKQTLQVQQDKIQCIVGRNSPANVAFGNAQYPQLWDYADNVDTLKFLVSLQH